MGVLVSMDDSQAPPVNKTLLSALPELAEQWYTDGSTHLRESTLSLDI